LLEITIAIETTCQGTRCHIAEAKHRDDVCGRESLEAKSQVVTSCTVDKNKSITVTANSNAVPKSNVYMHSVKVLVRGAIKGATPFGFGMVA
jgi:hypothetical protein